MMANYTAQRYASQIHTTYQATLEQTDTSVLQEARRLAELYNYSITPGVWEETATANALDAAAVDYDNLLNLTRDGVMGYVEIPKISVLLPIYHGTEADTLNRGIGHLLGSSLPVGGSSTHTILSGHSGMASQKMFTDLEDLSTGDVFYLQILGNTLAYQVVEINTVLPHDVSRLGIQIGRDLCTLITCTPYGVNTHRLLITGARIPYEKAEQIVLEAVEKVAVQSTWTEKYLFGLKVGCTAALSLGLVVFLGCQLWKHKPKKKKKRGGKYAR